MAKTPIENLTLTQLRRNIDDTRRMVDEMRRVKSHFVWATPLDAGDTKHAPVIRELAREMERLENLLWEMLTREDFLSGKFNFDHSEAGN